MIKFGAQKICPKCGAYNPSGVKLPDDCWHCKGLRNSVSPASDDKKKIDELDKLGEQGV